MALSVEPVNICNLSCPECPTGLKILHRNKGAVSLDLFKSIIHQVSKHTFLVNLYFQGEPFMHIKLFDLIRYAKSRGMLVSTSTNGLFITASKADKIVESGLDEIYVSLDGVTQEVYQKYRVGGDVDKVIEGIKYIVAAKKKLKSKYPIIRTQMLAFSFNEHQIKQFKQLSYDLGVDIADVKTAQVYGVDTKKHLLPKDDKLTRYATSVSGSEVIKGNIKNACWKHWSSCVVTWDGHVVPCCFDKDAHFTLGKLSTYDVYRIWKSDKYNSFRNLVLQKQSGIDICNNCPLSRR